MLCLYSIGGDPGYSSLLPFEFLDNSSYRQCSCRGTAQYLVAPFPRQKVTTRRVYLGAAGVQYKFSFNAWIEDLEVSVMEPLPIALTKIIKFTTEVCGILSAAGVPSAGIVHAALKLLSFVADDFASGFQRLNIAFKEISSDLEAIKEQLASQREAISQILEMVTELRYNDGVELIEGAYTTLLKGSHNLEATLEAMKHFIFEMESKYSQHLNIGRIKDYLDIVRKEKGQQAARELASYLLTVKTKYLIMESLYYTHTGDPERVAKEWEDFNQDTMEVIKYGGMALADIYEGDSVDGLKHGKGTMFYMGGDRYEGDWVRGMEHGHGSKTFDAEDTESEGGTYVGEFANGVFHGQGKRIYTAGVMAGTSYDGEWANGERSGKGKITYPGGKVYEGEWESGKRYGPWLQKCKVRNAQPKVKKIFE